MDSQRAPFQHARPPRGSTKASWTDATGQHGIFQGQREPAVRIKTKVTDGMRLRHVDAAKGLHLKIFAPKITCKVWTQNGCTKLKKSPAHV